MYKNVAILIHLMTNIIKDKINGSYNDHCGSKIEIYKKKTGHWLDNFKIICEI